MKHIYLITILCAVALSGCGAVMQTVVDAMLRSGAVVSVVTVDSKPYVAIGTRTNEQMYAFPIDSGYSKLNGLHGAVWKDVPK